MKTVAEDKLDKIVYLLIEVNNIYAVANIDRDMTKELDAIDAGILYIERLQEKLFGME